MTFDLIIALQPLYYIILVIISNLGLIHTLLFFHLPGSRAGGGACGGGSGGELSPG